ncbi:2'-5' RNA ligase family protein [Gramella sp. MAR_2010_147]|uniref:2'-5' RNA ligase family protein n=1 Tax=Gramella sp. MAR_2010_147 TaxID=1250205 RepID=UPI00087C6203|nr:2'-5' RNA ligase family protein [Gramella sp. MAR_2010_147]SDR96826.1 2'-5' RNA ligase [Gramella sp. MAR_2010_147]
MSKNKRGPLYFIAILPPVDIRNEIRSFKETISRHHDVKHALKLPAHLTLQIPFRIFEENESKLIEKLKGFSKMVDPFLVDLNGFGSFSKNVIFVKVLDHKPLINLHAELQQLIMSLVELKSHEISTKIHPHLTIAVRDLKRSNFSAVWKDFENKDYKNSFRAENLSLLKHNGKTWDIIEVFDFKKCD